MKLAVNTVIFGLNGALAEGLVLAELAGIDRALAYDVLAASAVGAPYVGYKRAAFVDPDGTPVAFSLDLAEKDLGLITDARRRRSACRCPRPPTNLAVMPDGIGGRPRRRGLLDRRGRPSRAAHGRPSRRRRARPSGGVDPTTNGSGTRTRPPPWPCDRTNRRHRCRARGGTHG